MQRYQKAFHALGSEAVFTIVTDMNQVYAEWLLTKLKHATAAFEQRFSRFLSSSELAKFNDKAGLKTPVSRPFRELLIASKDLSKRTDGVYNPFILPALQRAGYKGSWPTPESVSPDVDFEQREMATAGSLVIGDTWAKIPRNTALDFGGIGKGYLLDSLSKSFSKRHIHGYWLSLGGDVICSGRDLDGQNWHIGVQSATDVGQNIQAISNHNGETLAVATSGVIKRKGFNKGNAWHHIIDPRTERPAETDILTATLTAYSATVADVYAKAAIIVGSRQAKRLCQNSGTVTSGILQLNNGERVSW